MISNKPSLSSASKWLGQNAAAIPLLVAAVFTVLLSALGYRAFYQYVLAELLWSIAGGLTVILWFAGIWVRRVQPGPWCGRLTVAAIAVGFSVLLLNWPIYITFAVSRPALERVATEARLGDTVSLPRQAGLFSIERIEIRDRSSSGKSMTGVVCLWTEFDRAGSAGFVQCAPDDESFNIQSRTVLSPRWQFIAED